MEKDQILSKDTRKARLFQLLLEIPHWNVTTYAELARALSTHPRSIASMLKSNREPNRYPCYKVVRSDGAIGGYNLGTEEKIRRLGADGIEISNGKVPSERIVSFRSLPQAP